jgi:hypothetical protein
LVNDIDKQESKKESPLAPVKLVKQFSFDCTEPETIFALEGTAINCPLNASPYLMRVSSPFLLGIERPPAVVV